MRFYSNRYTEEGETKKKLTAKRIPSETLPLMEKDKKNRKDEKGAKIFLFLVLVSSEAKHGQKVPKFS